MLNRSTREPKRWSTALMSIGLGVLAVTFSACGDDEPELTVEDRLEEIAGRPLTVDEVAVQLETADELCKLDEQLLIRMWDKLDKSQFEFQQFVFTYHCPERVALIEGFVPRPTAVSTSSSLTPKTSTTTTKLSSTGNSGDLDTPTTAGSTSSGASVSIQQNTTATAAAGTTSTSSPLFGGPSSSVAGVGG